MPTQSRPDALRVLKLARIVAGWHRSPFISKEEVAARVAEAEATLTPKPWHAWGARGARGHDSHQNKG